MLNITNIKIIKAECVDIENISKLVQNIYIGYASHIDSKEGKKLVLDYASKKSIEERYNSSLILIAKDDTKIVGMIEIKNNNHISLCFIDNKYFRHGIGKGLFSSVKNILGERAYTVNSTPSAVLFYKSLGFKRLSNRIEINDGVCYVPMEY